MRRSWTTVAFIATQPLWAVTMDSSNIQLACHILIAVPHDAALTPVALAAPNHTQFRAYLAAIGYNPDACHIGTGKLANAEFCVDWDRTVSFDFAHAA